MSNDFGKIIDSCHYLLNNYSEASMCKDYLNARVNIESQNAFQFGYFPNIENIQALTSIIDESLLRNNELLFNKEIEDSLYPRKISFSFFDNHPLIMPYKDVYGEVVGIVGRSLLSDEDRQKENVSKYKNTYFNKNKHLFGLYENKKHILDKGCVFIVEGQFDVIKASECGMNNIVALGSAAMSAYQFSLITRYAKDIFLLLDSDEAGEKGRKRIIDKFGGFANIHNFYLPDPYKDIDEFLSENSYDSLSFVIKS